MNTTAAQEEEHPQASLPYARPWWLSPPVVAVALLVIGVLGIWGGRMDSGRRSREALAGAQVAVHRVDVIILAVDDIVETTVTPQAGRRAKDLYPKIPAAQQTVSSASQRLDMAGPGFSSAEASEAAALREGLKERAVLLKEAAAILPAARDAGGAMGCMRQAWASGAEASELSDRAADHYNGHTKEGVTESTRLTKLAIESLSDAMDRLLAANRAWSKPDLRALVAYVNGRQTLAAKSLKIDEVWLTGDTEKANTMLDAYSAEQAGLNSQAAALPAAEMKPILRAYDKTVGDSVERYLSARERAAKADGHLPPLGRRDAARAVGATPAR